MCPCNEIISQRWATASPATKLLFGGEMMNPLLFYFLFSFSFHYDTKLNLSLIAAKRRILSVFSFCQHSTTCALLSTLVNNYTLIRFLRISGQYFVAELNNGASDVSQSRGVLLDIFCTLDPTLGCSPSQLSRGYSCKRRPSCQCAHSELTFCQLLTTRK